MMIKGVINLLIFIDMTSKFDFVAYLNSKILSKTNLKKTLTLIVLRNKYKCVVCTTNAQSIQEVCFHSFNNYLLSIYYAHQCTDAGDRTLYNKTCPLLQGYFQSVGQSRISTHILISQHTYNCNELPRQIVTNVVQGSMQ